MKKDTSTGEEVEEQEDPASEEYESEEECRSSGTKVFGTILTIAGMFVLIFLLAAGTDVRFLIYGTLAEAMLLIWNDPFRLRKLADRSRKLMIVCMVSMAFGFQYTEWYFSEIYFFGYGLSWYPIAAAFLASFLAALAVYRFNRYWMEHELFNVAWTQRSALSMVIDWSKADRNDPAHKPEAVNAWEDYGHKLVVTMFGKLGYYESVKGLISMETGPVSVTWIHGYLCAATKYHNQEERLEALQDRNQKQQEKIRQLQKAVKSGDQKVERLLETLERKDQELQERVQEAEKLKETIRNKEYASGYCTDLLKKKVQDLEMQLQKLKAQDSSVNVPEERFEDLPQEERDRILSLEYGEAGAGQSLQKVAEKYGLTKSQVQKAIQRDQQRRTAQAG